MIFTFKNGKMVLRLIKKDLNPFTQVNDFYLNFLKDLLQPLDINLNPFTQVNDFYYTKPEMGFYLPIITLIPLLRSMIFTINKDYINIDVYSN